MSLTAMNVKRMLADFLRFVTPTTMHKARFSVLLDAVTALAKDARCTVTAIGRAMPGSSDKVSIKRADRLLSNTNLQRELPLIYAAMTRSIVSSKSQPLILVDWSNADTAKRHFILRASMATDGRALTLLQKVAAAEDYTCPHLHRAFLKQLKAMLPKDCKPVIVTDAGFKVPWLKQVRKLGWHYVARVRGNVKLKLAEQSELMTVNALYKKARATPKDLGEIVLTQSQQYETRAILVGKGYKLLKRDKNKSYKEPWLLVSSLPECHDYASKIAKCYSSRMQIEESFRDQKSPRYGLGSDLHGTKSKSRLNILLLLAALANWFHYLMGAAGEIAGVHLRYQANTIKNRRVLALNFLGILLCNESKIPIRRHDYQQGLKQILHWVAQWDWAQIKLAKS
ncbi:IS4 family transposase [Alishewanella sp. HL-SH05]|uniref:IS4 family transposase n=1 Tax=Alishewanella sp. HL-SH05 TaxID=3461145 RepID=UPI004042BC36